MRYNLCEESLADSLTPGLVNLANQAQSSTALAWRRLSSHMVCTT